jgi:hypothetical protein
MHNILLFFIYSLSNLLIEFFLSIVFCGHVFIYIFPCVCVVSWCWMQQGCEVVDCTGLDCDFAEAEGCIEGGLQEQEVSASWSASQEDQSYPPEAYQASSNTFFLISYLLSCVGCHAVSFFWHASFYCWAVFYAWNIKALTRHCVIDAFLRLSSQVGDLWCVD